jgi:hypothetical protein
MEGESFQLLIPRQNDPVFASCDITYIPIFLGGVMKACGNPPPIGIKSRSLPLHTASPRC